MIPTLRPFSLPLLLIRAEGAGLFCPNEENRGDRRCGPCTWHLPAQTLRGVNGCSSRGRPGARGAPLAQLLDAPAPAGGVERQCCCRNLRFCIVYPVLKWHRDEP